MKPRQTVILIVLGIALIAGWQFLVNWLWPTKPKPPKPNQETVTLVMGGMATGIEEVGKLKRVGTVEEQVAKEEEPKKKDEPPPKPEFKADPSQLPELIPLGHGSNPYYLQVLFNTHGGSVQQVVTSQFLEADREGLEVKENGKPKPMHLIPGVIRKRVPSIREQRKVKDPELHPGPVTDFDTYMAMSDPSFVLYHYEKPSDERPVTTLGTMAWKKKEVSNDPEADEQHIVFEAELGEPHNLVITKTFTLKRREYHIGLQVDIRRQEGKTGPAQFRYQLQGPNGLPIEGEWYATTYRQAVVGFGDDKGNAARYYEDARQVREWGGTDRQIRTDKLAIQYAAVAIQYFASAIAVDDQQENRRFIEFVRATPFGQTHKGQEFLDDVTVRTITESFSPDAGVTHKYILYNGPIKVRLLRQMRADQAVDDGLVERYLDKIHLDTLTDFPTTWVGRQVNTVGLSDLTIAFTNLIHSLLWALYQVVPNLGICIIIVTIIVRSLLFPLSKRQAHNAQVMQAKMAKLQPELRKLQEKYGDDFHRLNQERLKLYREHGVNPFAAMGGCLLLLLQMPVFMGLYYALQESVFFRLEGFLWMPNLAAPDMFLFWTESIPFISKPEDIGTTLYLGPYLNVLPIIAVVLMLYQQKKMMPPSDDPQVQAQQRMMKFMMILFGLFFYKVPAGLCLYFIASTLWGLAERRFMPKTAKPDEADGSDGSNGSNGGPKPPPEPPRPLGWFGRLKKRWRDKWHEILEQAQKQAEHRREQQDQPKPPQQPGTQPGGGGGGGGGGKKKKKKRK